MPVDLDYPMYVSHKTVRALEIEAISADYSGSVARHKEVTFRDPEAQGRVIQAAEAMFARYEPQPGDFMVFYPDGYQSFSPRKAFLDGYARIAFAEGSTRLT